MFRKLLIRTGRHATLIGWDGELIWAPWLRKLKITRTLSLGDLLRRFSIWPHWGESFFFIKRGERGRSLLHPNPSVFTFMLQLYKRFIVYFTYCRFRLRENLVPWLLLNGIFQIVLRWVFACMQEAFAGSAVLKMWYASEKKRSFVLHCGYASRTSGTQMGQITLSFV